MRTVIFLVLGSTVAVAAGNVVLVRNLCLAAILLLTTTIIIAADFVGCGLGLALQETGGCAG